MGIAGGVRPWRSLQSGFVVRHDDAINLLRFFVSGTRTTTEAIERGPLRRRLASTVLRALVEEGLVTVSDEYVQRRGRRRARVVRVTEHPHDLGGPDGHGPSETGRSRS